MRRSVNPVKLRRSAHSTQLFFLLKCLNLLPKQHGAALKCHIKIPQVILVLQHTTLEVVWSKTWKLELIKLYIKPLAFLGINYHKCGILHP